MATIDIDNIEIIKGSSVLEITDPNNAYLLGYKNINGVKTTVQIDFAKLTPLFGVSQEPGQSTTLAVSQRLFTNEVGNIFGSSLNFYVENRFTESQLAVGGVESNTGEILTQPSGRYWRRTNSIRPEGKEKVFVTGWKGIAGNVKAISCLNDTAVIGVLNNSKINPDGSYTLLPGTTRISVFIARFDDIATPVVDYSDVGIYLYSDSDLEQIKAQKIPHLLDGGDVIYSSANTWNAGYTNTAGIQQVSNVYKYSNPVIPETGTTYGYALRGSFNTLIVAGYDADGKLILAIPGSATGTDVINGHITTSDDVAEIILTNHTSNTSPLFQKVDENGILTRLASVETILSEESPGSYFTDVNDGELLYKGRMVMIAPKIPISANGSGILTGNAYVEQSTSILKIKQANSIGISKHRYNKTITFVEQTDTLVDASATEIFNKASDKGIRLGAFIRSGQVFSSSMQSALASGLLRCDYYFPGKVEGDPSQVYTEAEFDAAYNLASTWFRGQFGRLPSTLSYGYGYTDYSNFAKKYFLSGRNSLFNLASNYEDYNLNTWINRPSSYRWYDQAKTIGVIAALNNMSKIIDKAFLTGGFVKNFTHWHQMTTETDANLQIGVYDKYFALLAEKNVNDDIHFCSYGEAVEYLVFREAIDSLSMIEDSEALKITLSNNLTAFQKSLIKIPVTIRIDLSDTILNGKTIAVSGASLYRQSGNEILVEVSPDVVEFSISK